VVGKVVAVGDAPVAEPAAAPDRPAPDAS
jgi:hypothetical protein